MKLHLPRVVLCASFLLLYVVTLQGQDLADPSHPHAHNSLQQIERDYRAGQLSLDQKVLYKLYATQSPQQLPDRYRSQDELPIKCGTPAIIEYHNNREHLSAAAVRQIELMMQQSGQMQEFHQSPSGRFNIEYEITGEHAVPTEDLNNNDVPDYVEAVAAAADSSYRHEVETLGYTDPLSSGAIYNITIRDLNFYGQTIIQNGSTAIEIENDFDGFPPNTDPEGDQIGAVKVTMAHEFKHAIQYAATNWSGETDLWAEMDATLMEEVVYDDVNDYYNYLENNDSIFNSPQESFYPGSYYHVSWALYFEEQYGPDFWPAVWDIINEDPEIRMVNAIREQLEENDSFTQSFVESHLWHYTSGDLRATASYGFEENEFYPNPTINQSLSGQDSLTTPVRISAFAANYNEFEPVFDREGFLQIDFNITNDSTGVGLFALLEDGSYETRIRAAENGESGIWTMETNWQWSEVRRLGIIIANSSESDTTSYTMQIYPDIPEQLALVQNYPNPFSPRTTIEYSLPEQSQVQLKVYDTAGRLVRTLRNEVLPPGFYEEIFDGSDLASGLYFYQLITDEESIVKRMTLIK